MIDTKELRRKLRSDDLVDHVDIHANVKSVLAELINSLEAAEKERDELRVELETERVRLAACGVVALANTPDSAKKARDMRPEYWSASCGDVARMVDENISLRARIEQMEKQVPICRAEDLRHAEILLPSLGLMPEDKLYALPGAQPAPSVQDASVRKAWARFSHELHRSPDAPYPGMADAFEQHFSQSFIDREWRAEATTWAAAWKAAKSHGAKGESE